MLSRLRGTLMRVPLLVPAVRAVRLFRQRRAFRREYTPDRHVLEQVIFPAVAARPDLRRVLLVGVDFYTVDYPVAFPGATVSSIDLNDDKAQFARRADRHVIGSVTDLEEHFGTGAFDAIFMTGVLGWGLDEVAGAERAIEGCAACLEPGGLLVLGWTTDHRPPPVPPSELAALACAFEPEVLPPFPAAVYPTFSALGMTFGFYRRR